MKELQCLQVERIRCIGTNIEHKLIAIKEIIDFICNYENAFAVRTYLAAYLVIRQSLFELITEQKEMYNVVRSMHL